MGDIADDLMDRALEELLEEQEYHRIERMLDEYEDDDTEVPPVVDDRLEYTCQECGAKGIIRTNKHTGARFIGCTAFPKCRNTYFFETKEKRYGI